MILALWVLLDYEVLVLLVLQVLPVLQELLVQQGLLWELPVLLVLLGCQVPPALKVLQE